MLITCFFECVEPPLPENSILQAVLVERQTRDAPCAAEILRVGSEDVCVLFSGRISARNKGVLRRAAMLTFYSLLVNTNHSTDCNVHTIS